MKRTITVTVELPMYLKQYLTTIYGPEPIRFPKHSLYNRFLVKASDPFPQKKSEYHVFGNNLVEIIMPWSHLKDPRTFNYIGYRDQINLRSEIVSDFNYDFIRFVKKKLAAGVLRKDATLEFMKSYNIDESHYSFECFYRNYHRRKRRLHVTIDESDE